ncbi:S-layer homology domain-containing protein [Paenibacillus sp. sgz500958]|uniref:S-layer homology domain-containing protein n=1 Tax=Paenibacillus sp. sgz500958 TaxID=3242475 RepID=UPI0036D4258C
MKRFKSKVILSLLLAVSLLVLPVVQGQNGVAEASGSSSPSVSTFDYFQNVYPALAGTPHVFKTATYEDIVNLFESEGTYAVLVGGSWSENTQAVIGHINEVAKELNVSAIYNFDTKLDGNSFDIADTSNPYANKYVDLINKYLTNLNLYDKTIPEHNVSYDNAGTTITANKVEAPFLFVYNKDHLDTDRNSAPIISYLSESPTQSELQADPNLVTQYKADVEEVLSAGSSFSVIDSSAYIKAAFNRNYENENPGKPTIFTDQQETLVYEHVTYHQLTKILASEGNYAFLFGGSWCPNTQAVIKYINAYAKKYNIQKIYFFDTKLDAGVTVAQPVNNPVDTPHKTDTLQIRTNNHPYAKLYVDLVSTYLSNIQTQNKTAFALDPTTIAKNTISYTGSSGTVTGDRLQVPYFFTYNKDNKDANGASAPVLGHIELMYTWSSIQPDYVYQDYPVGARYTNYIKALDTVLSKLETVPTGLSAQAPSTVGSTDGQIKGVNKRVLEYKLTGASAYTAVPAAADTITGLAPGTYLVRYAATYGYQGPTTAAGAVAVSYPAGQSVEIVVPASTVPASPGAGSPGGSSPTPAPTSAPLNTGAPAAASGNTVTAVVSASSKTDAATGVTTATVAADAISGLVETVKKAEAEGKTGAIEIKLSTSADTKTAELTVPRTAFNSVASGTKAALKVNYEQGGTITFDAKSVASISGAANNGDISIAIAKVSLTDEGKAVLGDRPVYDLSVKAGDSKVSAFGGKVSVSVPYTLQTGEDPNSIIIYYINSSGGLDHVRGRYNAATGSVEFVTTHFSQYIIGHNKVAFTDVARSSWYSPAVSFLAAREITSGTDAGNYNPAGEITRGQFIVLLLKAYGVAPDGEGADNFSDAGSTYYTPYLAAAKRLGVATGAGENQFKPDAPITRQELFTLLYRSLEVLGEVPAGTNTADLNTYIDAGLISGYAREALQALSKGGIIEGDQGKLNPLGLSTRAQAAQVIYNLLSQ